MEVTAAHDAILELKERVGHSIIGRGRIIERLLIGLDLSSIT